MSELLYKLFTEEFKTNMELLLQQRSSLLRPHVTSDASYRGQYARVINQLNVVEFKAPSGKFAPLDQQNPDFAARWISPQDMELTLRIDSFDLLKTIVDPKGQYSMAVSAAAGRFWDDLILTNAVGTANVGTGTSATGTTEAWSTSYDVADTFDDGSTSTGLTPAKLIEANRILRHAHAFDDPSDEAGKVLVIGSTAEANLMSQVQVVDADYAAGMLGQPLINGSMNGRRFLGWNLVVSERLPYASSVRTCIGWVPSGIHLGIWQDMMVRVDQAIWLSSQPYQLYAKLSAGVTRTQLGKVVKVKVADTVTGDTAGTGGP